jgi:hypothetical protein
MTAKTHGYAALNPKASLQPFELDLGELGSEEVEIKVKSKKRNYHGK